jgi:hypothetical protein
MHVAQSHTHIACSGNAPGHEIIMPSRKRAKNASTQRNEELPIAAGGPRAMQAARRIEAAGLNAACHSVAEKRHWCSSKQPQTQPQLVHAAAAVVPRCAGQSAAESNREAMTGSGSAPVHCRQRLCLLVVRILHRHTGNAA